VIDIIITPEQREQMHRQDKFGLIQWHSHLLARKDIPQGTVLTAKYHDIRFLLQVDDTND
jgi:hypothetical protein